VPLLLSETHAWLGFHGGLLFPFLIALWISWGDLKYRKIPNYLTLGTALAGLAFNLTVYGWVGLVDGVLGLLLGFACLILPYLLGGMGAGDVKALAALGAWLGPKGTLLLFCYMGIAGGLMALGVLIWKGLLWVKIRRGWAILHNLVLNLVLCRDHSLALALPQIQKTAGIPYGVAIALGMGVLLLTGGAGV
jgi:prepilin peptidase CpaA